MCSVSSKIYDDLDNTRGVLLPKLRCRCEMAIEDLTGRRCGAKGRTRLGRAGTMLATDRSRRLCLKMLAHDDLDVSSMRADPFAREGPKNEEGGG